MMDTGFLKIRHRGELGQIEYQRLDTGSGGRPVLVFLHEGLGTAGSWKTIPRDLASRTGCPAFSYTRFGYGRSSGIKLPRKINYIHTEAMAVLPRVLRGTGIKEYILVGHSDGGSIALIHGGSTYAEGLKGIITLAAHLFCEPLTLKGLKQARRQYEKGDLKSKLERIHKENTEAAFWGWNDTWLAPRFLHWNIEKYLRHIQVPLLALQGADDAYGTLAQLDAMRAGAPDCQTRVIENCGHVPHLQQPEATMALMAEFIRTLV